MTAFVISYSSKVKIFLLKQMKNEIIEFINGIHTVIEEEVKLRGI